MRVAGPDEPGAAVVVRGALAARRTDGRSKASGVGGPGSADHDQREAGRRDESREADHALIMQPAAPGRKPWAWGRQTAAVTRRARSTEDENTTGA